MKFLLGTFTSAVLIISSPAFANVPVIDLNQQSSGDQAQTGPVPNASLSLEQRVNILEQQITNITQMNLPSKLDNLQQQIQALNGQLEEQAHNIQTLSDQERNYYQDLDKRISELKTALKNNPTPSASVATNSTSSQIDTTTAVTTSNTKTSADEEHAYQAAFGALINKQYEKASTGFQSFLKDYPNSKYAANAHYWLGEVNLQQGKTDVASDEFSIVINNYVASPKVPDAQLKLALIHDKAGQHEQARQELQKIVQQYPGTSAARLATMRLQQMKASY